MKYKSVIFDWDGTLGMTLHLWLEAYKSELKRLGRDYSNEIIVSDFFYEHQKTKIKYPDLDFALYLRKVLDYMINNVSHVKLYEGARETLEKLQSKDIVLTLVSSNERKLLEKVLELNNLTKFFKAISGFDDTMKHKPDPAPFLYILEVAKLDPKTTIVIGDSYADIIASKAAGLDCCIFLPAENKIFYDFEKLKAMEPTYCVESLQEFADLITK